MLWVGGDDGHSRATRPALSSVLGAALTVAAVASMVGIIGQTREGQGLAISDSIVLYALQAAFTMGVALAASLALALAASEPAGAAARHWLAWALVAVTFTAAATFAAALYASGVVILGRSIGHSDFVATIPWKVKLAYVGAMLATAVLAAAALFVVARRTAVTAAATRPLSRVGRANVVALTIALAGLIVRAGAAGVGSPAALTARVAETSYVFTSSPIALLVLAIAVVLALGANPGGRRDREPLARVAGIVGLLCVAIAAYAIWYSTANHGDEFATGFILSEWWGRISATGGALSAAVLGASAAWITLPFKPARAADPMAAEIAHGSAEPVGSDLRVVGLGVGVALLVATIGTVVFDVINVVLKDREDVGSRLLNMNSAYITTLGLAFTATLLLVACRRRNPVSVSIAVLVRATALAALAASAYSIAYVGFVAHDAGFSIVVRAGNWQRLGYAGGAIAIAALAIATLQAGSRRADATTAEPPQGEPVPGRA